MKPIHILAHMALFSVLLLFTLLGLAGINENGGGYLWLLLVVGSPFFAGFQICYILNFGE